VVKVPDLGWRETIFNVVEMFEKGFGMSWSHYSWVVVGL